MCSVTEAVSLFFHWYAQLKGSMLFRSLYESDNTYNDSLDPWSCSLIEQRTENKEKYYLCIILLLIRSMTFFLDMIAT